MWPGRTAETCYECLRGENKQKLEVLSFEKAWDKIEKNIFLKDVCIVQMKCDTNEKEIK